MSTRSVDYNHTRHAERIHANQASSVPTDTALVISHQWFDDHSVIQQLECVRVHLDKWYVRYLRVSSFSLMPFPLLSIRIKELATYSPYDSLSLFTSPYRISDFEKPGPLAPRPSYPMMKETFGILYVIWQAIPAPHFPPPPPSPLYTHLRSIFSPN